ncbi:MAG: hypothetical protein GY751_24395 [Bacteroidetes bacterium]|nr:hypothetical protein [Bacteroidota bacterium]
MTELKFKSDASGFPMVWIDDIEAYIHWLPVTKIQFEYFLCAAPDTRFDASWYDEVLSLNPRISPSEIKASNYWNTLLTGIMPSEVQRFARWCGDGYMIPTLKDWFEAYQFLKTLPPESPDIIDKMGELNERVKAVLTHLDSASGKAIQETGYERTLADQMLMRMGAMEWVECPDQRFEWGGMGQTHPSFYGSLFTPDHGQPSRPNNPEENRLHSYGFRLIRRSV